MLVDDRDPKGQTTWSDLVTWNADHLQHYLEVVLDNFCREWKAPEGYLRVEHGDRFLIEEGKVKLAVESGRIGIASGVRRKLLDEDDGDVCLSVTNGELVVENGKTKLVSDGDVRLSLEGGEAERSFEEERGKGRSPTATLSARGALSFQDGEGNSFSADGDELTALSLSLDGRLEYSPATEKISVFVGASAKACSTVDGKNQPDPFKLEGMTPALEFTAVTVNGINNEKEWDLVTCGGKVNVNLLPESGGKVAISIPGATTLLFDPAGGDEDAAIFPDVSFTAEIGLIKLTAYDGRAKVRITKEEALVNVDNGNTVFTANSLAVNGGSPVFTDDNGRLRISAKGLGTVLTLSEPATFSPRDGWARIFDAHRRLRVDEPSLMVTAGDGKVQFRKQASDETLLASSDTGSTRLVFVDGAIGFTVDATAELPNELLNLETVDPKIEFVADRGEARFTSRSSTNRFPHLSLRRILANGQYRIELAARIDGHLEYLASDEGNDELCIWTKSEGRVNREWQFFGQGRGSGSRFEGAMRLYVRIFEDKTEAEVFTDGGRWLMSPLESESPMLFDGKVEVVPPPEEPDDGRYLDPVSTLEFTDDNPHARISINTEGASIDLDDGSMVFTMIIDGGASVAINGGRPSFHAENGIVKVGAHEGAAEFIPDSEQRVKALTNDDKAEILDTSGGLRLSADDKEFGIAGGDGSVLFYTGKTLRLPVKDDGVALVFHNGLTSFATDDGTVRPFTDGSGLEFDASHGSGVALYRFSEKNPLVAQRGRATLVGVKQVAKVNAEGRCLVADDGKVKIRTTRSDLVFTSDVGNSGQVEVFAAKGEGRFIANGEDSRLAVRGAREVSIGGTEGEVKISAPANGGQGPCFTVVLSPSQQRDKPLCVGKMGAGEMYTLVFSDSKRIGSDEPLCKDGRLTLYKKEKVRIAPLSSTSGGTVYVNKIPVVIGRRRTVIRSPFINTELGEGGPPVRFTTDDTPLGLRLDGALVRLSVDDGKVRYQYPNSDPSDREKDRHWLCPMFQWGAAEESTLEFTPSIGSDAEGDRCVWDQDVQIYNDLSYVQNVGTLLSRSFFSDLTRLYREIPYKLSEYGVELLLEGWTGPYVNRLGNQDIQQMVVRYTFQQQ